VNGTQIDAVVQAASRFDERSEALTAAREWLATDGHPVGHIGL